MEPQVYLESYCNYNSTTNVFYSLDEAVWTSYSILASGMVIPCMRDQNELFSGPPDLFQNLGMPFNIFYKYVPLVGMATQLLSLVMALIGYYSKHASSEFACLGIRTLMLPFSIGMLLPVISVHVKVNKDNVPHATYMKSIFNFILPIVFAAVGLPGLDQVLPGILKAFKCCGSCCCSPKLCCKPPDFSPKAVAKAATKYISTLALVAWASISLVFAIAPVIVFIGNFILIVANAVVISVVVAILTYLATLLRKLYDYRSLSKAISMGLTSLVKEALAIKPQEFDLTQSIHILSPLAFVFVFFGIFELATGVYWGNIMVIELLMRHRLMCPVRYLCVCLVVGGDAYGAVAQRGLDCCSRAWRATFSPHFGRKIVSSSFGGHGLLHYAQSISTVSAVVLYVNEVVFVTVAKYLVVRYAKNMLASEENASDSESLTSGRKKSGHDGSSDL